MAEQTIEDGAGRDNDPALQDADTPQTAPSGTDVEESGAGYGNHGAGGQDDAVGQPGGTSDADRH